jgi:acetyltransferase-like isoleucine patch superfamily enzyme
MLSSLARRVAAPVSRRGLLAPASSRILSSSSPSSSSSSSPSSSFSWQPEQCKHLLFKPEVGANSFVADSAKLIGHVTLGEDCSVFDCVVMRADINFIAAGANTNVQDGTVIHVNDDDGVTLGANVTVGHACILHGCTIEDNVLVGMGR